MMASHPRTPDARRDSERLLRALSGRGLTSWGLSSVLLLGLGLAVGLLSYTGLAATSEAFSGPQPLARLTVGLAILLVVFAVYAILQQRRFAALARTLIAEHDRATALDVRLSEITALFDVAARLHLHLDVEPVLETITSRLLPCLEADEASIMLLDEPSQELRCLAVSGADVDMVREAAVRMGEGIAGRVAETREATVILASDVASRFPGEEKAWRGIGSALCVPMVVSGEVVGVLNVSRLADRAPFTREDARLLMPFAEHLAITVRRIGEFEALDRRASAFDRMHALRREFLCALNHELRNPLASVMGYAELLASDNELFGPAERASFTQSLSEQAGRMLESVDDLHGLYSLEASEVTFEATPGSLNQLVSDSLTGLQSRLDRKRLHVDLRLDPDLPEVWMDLGKLHTAIRHLLAGTMRVASNGSTVVVATRVEVPDAARGQVVLEIQAQRESGVGVFGAGDASGRPETEHTDSLGWGVMLIRELVTLHGGALRSAGTADGRFQFELSLPARHARAADAA